MKLGIEVLDQNTLKGHKVGLLAHPASLNQNLQFILDVFSNINVTCLFNPQHGFEGVKQDNMAETYDEKQHSIYKIPLYSLYGKTRRPQPYMLENCDIVVVDLQDVGCRIYTYITTLFYLLEECKKQDKEVWILDRPNPLGRTVEGSFLEEEFKSFVGIARLPMRHGLTIGEIALWYKKQYDFDVKVISMEGYDINKNPWPLSFWVNPSPNLPSVGSCYNFVGGSLLEGTWLSEGRGTTRPFEVLGSPFIDPFKVKKALQPQELFSSCILSTCYFEPTFNKYKGNLCKGFQIHIKNYSKFKPYRIFSVLLKTIYKLYPSKEIFRDFTYEYENTRKAFDLISGSGFLRTWIESQTSSYEDLNQHLLKAEKEWEKQRADGLIY